MESCCLLFYSFKMKPGYLYVVTKGKRMRDLGKYGNIMIYRLINAAPFVLQMHCGSIHRAGSR